MQSPDHFINLLTTVYDSADPTHHTMAVSRTEGLDLL